jgi:hypothetical protein
MIVYLAKKTRFRADIPNEHGRLAHSCKTTSTGKLIADALEAVEKENPKLKNIPVESVYDRRTLKSRIARRQPQHSRPNSRRTNPRKTGDVRRPTLQLQIDPANLARLAPALPPDDAGLIATIPFH